MGEPEAIIQEFPADCATGSWDPRMHALGEALLFDVSHDDGRNGKVRCGYLMSDGMIVTFAGDGTRFSKRTEAPYDGRIPCELLAYRPDSKRPFGRSRINRTVMSLTDSAVRTFLRSELQAELYSVPPRYFLGVTEDMFTDEDGESIPMWRIALDKVLAIPRDETTGSVPEVGQFQQYSFEPHVTQLRNTATMFAAATSLPPDAMGALTSNPSSAEAIDKAVKELCLDAESCQRRFGPAWERIIDRAQKYAGSDGMATVRVSAQWRNPATPSRAAAADASRTRAGGHPARRQRSHLGHARSVPPATPDVAPRSPESTRPSANRPVEDPNRSKFEGGEGWEPNNLNLPPERRQRLERLLDQAYEDYIDDLENLTDAATDEIETAYRRDPLSLKEDVARDYTDQASQLANDYYDTVRQLWQEEAGVEFTDFDHTDLIDSDRVLWQQQGGYSNTDYNGLTYTQVKNGQSRSGATIDDLWPALNTADDWQQFIADD